MGVAADHLEHEADLATFGFLGLRCPASSADPNGLDARGPRTRRSKTMVYLRVAEEVGSGLARTDDVSVTWERSSPRFSAPADSNCRPSR